MAFNALAFGKGLLEGAVEVKQSREKQQQEIQDQIRKFQLKALEGQMDQQKVRKATAQRVQSAVASGNLEVAMASIMKAEDKTVDWDYITKNNEIDYANPRVKEYINYWVDQNTKLPELDYESEINNLYAASAQTQRNSAGFLSKLFGVDEDQVVTSSSVAARYNPEKDEALLAASSPASLPLKKKEDVTKPVLDKYDVTIDGKTYRAARLVDPRTGRQVGQEQIGGGPRKEEPVEINLDKLEVATADAIKQQFLDNIDRNTLYPQTTREEVKNYYSENKEIFDYTLITQMGRERKKGKDIEAATNASLNKIMEAAPYALTKIPNQIGGFTYDNDYMWSETVPAIAPDGSQVKINWYDITAAKAQGFKFQEGVDGMAGGGF